MEMLAMLGVDDDAAERIHQKPRWLTTAFCLLFAVLCFEYVKKYTMYHDCIRPTSYRICKVVET